MMRAVLLFLLLLTGPAHAQEALSAGEVDAIRARTRAQTREAEDFATQIRRRAARVRGDAEETVRQAQANRAQVSSSTAGPTTGLDLGRLVAQSAQLHGASDEMGPQLLAFVSFSLPDAALRQIVRDMTRVGGVVVFRGLPENSIQTFRARLMAALGTPKAPGNIGIDPRLFRAFGVTHAPTFVVVSTGFDLCDGFECRDVPPAHDRMTGNVSVHYVLETVAAGRGPGAAVAKVLARRLERGGRQP